jgi:hypothetical protein
MNFEHYDRVLTQLSLFPTSNFRVCWVYLTLVTHFTVFDRELLNTRKVEKLWKVIFRSSYYQVTLKQFL